LRETVRWLLLLLLLGYGCSVRYWNATSTLQCLESMLLAEKDLHDRKVQLSFR
jgi:hypothetical protein